MWGCYAPDLEEVTRIIYLGLYLYVNEFSFKVDEEIGYYKEQTISSFQEFPVEGIMITSII